MSKSDIRTAGLSPEVILSRAYDVILPSPNGRKPPPIPTPKGALHVGVDLGTAYTVLVVLNEEGLPIAGEYRFTQVVRDGLVVDFISAVDTLRDMKKSVENRIGRILTHAASGFPPGVPPVEVRATGNVVEGAGMACPVLIREPVAANSVLGIKDGVIVDIGGGTTGIAILNDGEVVLTADEPTGGTHMSLVIAGGANITLEEAELLKIDLSHHSRLFPVVRPVMEKIGTHIVKHVQGFRAESIVLVGGTSLFPGIDTVIQEVTQIPTQVAHHPLFVTPIGIAMHDHHED